MAGGLDVNAGPDAPVPMTSRCGEVGPEGAGRAPAGPAPAPAYVELHCRSAFSLLGGASLPETLVARAQAVGLPGLALTDRHDLGGVVRFAQATRAAGIAGLIGAELDVVWPDASLDAAHDPLHDAAHADPPAAEPLVLLAESREGYAHIATLVTQARMTSPRGRPSVTFAQLAAHAAGVHVLTGGPRGRVPALLARGRADAARAALGQLRDAFDGRVAVECWDHGLPEERALVADLIPLAQAVGVPWVVTNDVRYADAQARAAYDVLCALRHGRPLHAMGTRLPPNGEWYLRGPAATRAALASRARRRARERGDRGALHVPSRAAPADAPDLPDAARHRRRRVSGGAGGDGRTRPLGRGGHGPAHGRARSAARARAVGDPAAGDGGLLPDRVGHRALRPQRGDPLPGTRLGGQQRRLLLPRASPRSTRSRWSCCSSASSARSGRRRPTSTSTSRTASASACCSTSTSATGARMPRWCASRSPGADAARCATRRAPSASRPRRPTR